MADYDFKSFDQMRKHAAEMESDDTKRNNMLNDMERLYWMHWDEERAVTDQMKNIKVTRSPLARNSIVGAMRLLTASDPVIEVPHDINNPQQVEQSSKTEKFLRAMWFASGRISGDPLHYDVVRSALLYSEVVIAINSTKDMARMSTIPAVKSRMEDIAEKTPYLFEVWSPKGTNTERDKFGVTAFHRKLDTTAGHIEDVYGEDGVAALKSNANNKLYSRSDKVTLHTFYDLRDICLWMDGRDKPIKFEPHGLPFIPIVAQTVEGSQLFKGSDSWYTQEPFLYTLQQTNLVERQNLMLTTMYTMLFAIGANPMFVETLHDPNNYPESDYTEPGGVIRYRIGETRVPMAKQIIDPSLMQGWEISQDLEAQSTIYKQTLGEPLGTNAPYSMVALLSQSGRLPLIATQRKAGWAIGEALEIAIKWMKKENVTGSAKYESMTAQLAPQDIPDNIDISVQLEINMPTDRLQAANAANMLAQGETPIVSKEWARSNVLNIGQSEDMDKEIWTEKAREIFFQKFMYEQLMELAQMKQAAMMPGNMGGQPGAPAGQPPMPQPGAMPQGMPVQRGAPQQGMPPPQSGTPPQPNTPPGAEPIEPIEPIEPALSLQRPR